MPGPAKDRGLKRLRARLRTQGGWTLTEMMFAILVSSLVLGAATNLLSSVAALNGTTNRQSDAQDTARTAIDGLSSQLRNAIGPSGKAPIYSPASGSTAGTSDIVFYSPVASASLTNNVRGLAWVRYCLNYTTPANETLWKQTKPYDTTQLTPPSTSTCPNAAWTTQQLVASSIVNMASTPNTSLFTPSVDAAGAIHDIQVRMLIQGSSIRRPTPVTSSIDFRNAKTAPTATMTCRTQNGHAICDASKSTDPDGEALSFKWKYLCCSPAYSGGDTTWENNQTTYLFDKGGLSSGSTYGMYVQVTDVSGLSTTASQAVTMP